MKKIVLLLGMAAAMVNFAGCQKNEIEDPNAKAEGSSFELVAEIAQTKTTLDGLSVEWEEGDVLYLVTTDGTWGAPYANDTEAATIAEYAYNDGKFTTGSTISDGEYTFNAMYARANQKSYHRGASTTHKLEATQSQDCANPTAHIKENDALVGTFTATTPMTEAAQVTMSHIYTMMQVDVKNNTGAEIEVAKFEMTAEGADIAGVFNVESFETPSISIKQNESSAITVNVTNGTVAAGESLPVYFVMAPLSNYSGDVTFKVTDAEGKTYTKTVTLNGISFEAGKYNTTPYTISSADVVEPEPENVTWNLSINETSEVSDTKIAWTSDFAEMYCEKGGASTPTNNYYGGNSDSRTSTRFYKNSVLTIASKTGYKITSVVFTATSANYATALSGSSWTNASAEVNTTTVTVTPTNGTQPMTATIGGTCGFTSVVVYYTENEGGETPEPEPKTLVSIAVENPQIEYTVGDEFVEPTVKATYDDASTETVTGATFSGNDLASEGTKEVTVSYTEGEVTVTTSYNITVSATVVDDSDYSGQYAIVAYRNSESLYYYLTNEETSTSTVRLTAVSAGANMPEDNVEVAASKLWNVSKSGSVYTIQSVASEEYVSWTSGNSAVMSETGLQFTVTKQDDGSFNFVSGDRYLSLNGTQGNDYFAMYAGTQAQDLYLIKAVEGEEAPATLESIAVSGEKTTYTVGEEFVKPTVTATYSDGSKEDVTASATFDGYNMSVADTYTVTVSYEDKTTTYQITVSDVVETDKTWTLVTDVNNLAVGDQVVIVASASNNALSTTQNSNNRGQASVSKSGNTITFGSDVQILTLETGKTTGTYAFNTGSGYLYAASSSKNYLRTETTLSANSSWTISITSAGVATVKANGTNTRNWMRYNSSSRIFSCYSSGQLDIAIYKLQ
ncbi:MAG: hypothetical protein E7115_01705 [Bacteroidales bacterium]|nr:hypothetical protein [Bacteroidales bacterium]